MASRFAQLTPVKPTIRKPPQNKRTLVVEGAVYTYQKGTKQGEESGNAGVNFAFDKSYNNPIKAVIAPLDLVSEYRWNGTDAYKMKQHNIAQLKKIMQAANDFTGETGDGTSKTCRSSTV